MDRELIKYVFPILFFIYFFVSLFYILKYSNKANRTKSITVVSISLCIISIFFGITSIFTKFYMPVEENTTNNEVVEEDEEESIIEEVGEVYNIERIYYLSKENKYIVTIILPDNGKKLIKLNDITVYKTLKSYEKEYIEIYKDESKNKIYLYEDREEQEPPIDIQLQEDETMEETTDTEEDTPWGIYVIFILAIIAIFFLIGWLM